MKIYIKNMVCNRCKMTVKSELEKTGINFKTIDLVEIETNEEVSHEKLRLLDKNLRQNGLQLIKNHKEILSEKIKTAIIEVVHYSEKELKHNLSYYLT